MILIVDIGCLDSLDRGVVDCLGDGDLGRDADFAVLKVLAVSQRPDHEGGEDKRSRLHREDLVVNECGVQDCTKDYTETSDWSWMESAMWFPQLTTGLYQFSTLSSGIASFQE
jgi:hypothetical protein